MEASLNHMTPMTRKRKAEKPKKKKVKEETPSLDELWCKNVTFVGVYDNAEDMIKDLEKPAKKQKTAVDMLVENTLTSKKTAERELTNNAPVNETLYEDLQCSDDEELSQSILAKVEPPSPVKTEPPSQDDDNEGFKRMVRMATIFQSPGFVNGHQPEGKPETKQPEPKPDLTEKFPPREKPKPPVDMFQTEKVDYMVCPFHFNRLEQRTSKTGWRYVSCPFYQCRLFCDEKQALGYMQEIYRNLHPHVYDVWDEINCFCGGKPNLKQSFSDKNPNRLYLTCSAHPRCKLFRWVDQPIEDLTNLPTTDPAWKDPLSVSRWLKKQTTPPQPPAAPPPPKYSDSVPNWLQSMEDCKVDYNPVPPNNYYTQTGYATGLF